MDSSTIITTNHAPSFPYAKTTVKVVAIISTITALASAALCASTMGVIPFGAAIVIPLVIPIALCTISFTAALISIVYLSIHRTKSINKPEINLPIALDPARVPNAQQTESTKINPLVQSTTDQLDANEKRIRSTTEVIELIEQNVKTTLNLNWNKLCENVQSFNGFVIPDWGIPYNDIRSLGNSPEMQNKILEQAKAVRPVLHAKVSLLLTEFLNHKIAEGTEIEKSLYRTMTIHQFIQRLLEKKPFVIDKKYLPNPNPKIPFSLQVEYALLRNGTELLNPTHEFEKLTSSKDGVISLNDYLSIDEIQLAAFLLVSTPTLFIHEGWFSASPECMAPCEKEGVYVGMVGARRKVFNLNEHIFVCPDVDRSDAKWNLWAKFYGLKDADTGDFRFPTFLEAQKHYLDGMKKGGIEIAESRYIHLNGHSIEDMSYFDKEVYKRCMQIHLESFLLEADAKAEIAGKKAFLHLIPLGIEQWMQSGNEGDVRIYIQETQIEIYKELIAKHQFAHISDFNFSSFELKEKRENSKIEVNGNIIELKFSTRRPAQRLEGDDAGKLLVAQYSSTGRTFPGNEFWRGELSRSAEQAAACCSTIAQLANPLINPYVRGSNISVVA